MTTHIPHPMTEAWNERAERIIALIGGRHMTLRAATTVVDAAMFGVGCTEGKVRELIEREKRNES